jgi:hypothetical protein
MAATSLHVYALAAIAKFFPLGDPSSRIVAAFDLKGHDSFLELQCEREDSGTLTDMNKM